MKRKKVPLMIMAFSFQVIFARLHGCFAEHAQGQSPWERTTVHPTAVNGPESSVFVPLSGNVYPLGHYTVTIEIGNPPKPFELDVHTASVLTWVQCDAPCTGCTLPPDHLYKPVKNSFVLCKDPICAAFLFVEPQQCKTPNEKCVVEVNYVEGDSVIADIVLDSFPLRLVNGNLLSPRVAFGCGFHMANPGPTAGILELGKSKAIVSSQLSGMGITKNVVSHCLGAQGVLVIGADFVPESGLSWMPMLGDSSFDTYYSPGPAQLLFDGKPAGVKGFNVNFDTGATYTYLSSEIYQTLLNLTFQCKTNW